MFLPSAYTAPYLSDLSDAYAGPGGMGRARGGKAKKKGGKKKEDPLKLHGVDRMNEKALRAAGDKAKKAMWKAKILTKERVALEKRANEFYEAADQARRVRNSKLLDAPPDKLWDTPNDHRLVNFGGIFGQILGTPSDSILAIAGGAKYGAPFADGEMRKAILGGLLALQSAGVPGVRTAGLQAPIVGSEQVNADLAKAAGMGGKPLEAVYKAVVKRVSSYGPAMESLAWAYRMQLWIKDVAGIEAVHATAGAVVSLFTPVGTVVGAAVGAHSAITLALGKVLSLKAEAIIAKNLPRAKREAAKKGSTTARSGGGAMSRTRGGGAPLTSSPIVWVGLGAGALGVAYWWSQR